MRCTLLFLLIVCGASMAEAQTYRQRVGSVNRADLLARRGDPHWVRLPDGRMSYRYTPEELQVIRAQQALAEQQAAAMPRATSAPPRIFTNRVPRLIQPATRESGPFITNHVWPDGTYRDGNGDRWNVGKRFGANDQTPIIQDRAD